MVCRATSLLAALLILGGCTSPAPPTPSPSVGPVSPSASPAAVDTIHPTQPAAPGAPTPTSLAASSASFLGLSPLPSASNPPLPAAASLPVARGLDFAVYQPFGKNAVQSVYQLAN